MLDSRLTFASYEVSPQDEAAVSRLKTCVLTTSGEHVHLSGAPGCGKTHLLQALAIHRQVHEGGRIWFRTAEYLAALLRCDFEVARLAHGADVRSSVRPMLWVIDSWQNLKPGADRCARDFLKGRIATGDSVFTASVVANPPDLEVQTLDVRLHPPTADDLAAWLERRLALLPLFVTELSLRKLVSLCQGNRRLASGVVHALARLARTAGPVLADEEVDTLLQTRFHHAI